MDYFQYKPGSLFTKIGEINRYLKDTNKVDEEEAFALATFLENNIWLLSYVFERSSMVKLGSVVDLDWYKIKVDAYCSYMEKDFFDNMEFHKKFIAEIYSILNNEKYSFYPYFSEFSEGAFFDLFRGFLNYFGLEELFDSIIENGDLYRFRCGNIFGAEISKPQSNGFSILLQSEYLNLAAMKCLAHEFGHAYFNRFPFENYGLYNLANYSFSDREVFSSGFELLLFYYLAKNNILPDEVRDLYFLFLEDGFRKVMTAYSSSFLTIDDIKSRKFKVNISELIVSLPDEMKDKFLSFKCMPKRVDFLEAFEYSYGYIFSVFFADSVLNEGLDNPLTRFFIEHRSDPFDGELLLKQGLTPEKFGKIYYKQMEMFKK